VESGYGATVKLQQIWHATLCGSKEKIEYNSFPLLGIAIYKHDILLWSYLFIFRFDGKIKSTIIIACSDFFLDCPVKRGKVF